MRRRRGLGARLGDLGEVAIEDLEHVGGLVEVARHLVPLVDDIAWEVGVVVLEVLRDVAHLPGKAAHDVLHEHAGVA